LIAVSGCVLRSPRGKGLGDPDFHRNVWSLAQEKAGVACTLDDLRHMFASRLLAAGIPLIEVSAWMAHGLRAGGHEVTNTTTRVYVHVTGESRQAALDELATLIAASILDANSVRHESV
jgi:integrase